MTEAHRRKKNPEQVRQAIVEAAIHQGMDGGLPSISLDKVAAAAGVTKGGLLHHFSTKQALLDATIDHLLGEVQLMVDRLIAGDDDEHGRFTRAYVKLSFDETMPDRGWTVLWASVLTDPAFSKFWDRWIAAQLDLHGERPDHPALQAARYAADGVWAATLTQSAPTNLQALRDHIVAMTRA
ncbi:MAG: TetR family transcriptional regulator [Mesorhizobium sp.]